MFAWELNGPADWMLLYPGAGNSLTIYCHGWLCNQLFGDMGPFHLLIGSFP